jgi:hypothetical protein
MKNFKINLPILSIILTACATAQPLAILETPGNYPPPIDKAAWAYTQAGFYLSRDTVFGDKISYTAIYDNRPARKQLIETYEPTERFIIEYPSFIKHRGVTDCKTNKVGIEQLNANMKVMHSDVLEVATEVSQALCRGK